MLAEQCGLPAFIYQALIGVRGCSVETWMMPWASTRFVSHYFSCVAVQKLHIVTKFDTCVTVILVRSSGKTLFADISYFGYNSPMRMTDHYTNIYREPSFWFILLVSIHFSLSSSWRFLWLHRKIISTSKLRAHAPSFACLHQWAFS